MSYEDLDPEVAADLAFRDASERDPKRAREMPAWAPPRVVSRVPCRGRCGVVVDWPEEAELAAQTWDRVLADRGEAAIDRTMTVFCSACRARGAEMRAAGNRKMVDAMAEAIRELKLGCQPHRENELLDKLERAGHPDIAGLKQWLKDRDSKKGGRTTKGDL